MKTRIIHTKIFKDGYFTSLNPIEKNAFIYLLFNERVNLCGIYELSDREKRFDLDLSTEKLEDIKRKFQTDGRFEFIGDWVVITHYSKYNNYSGEKNDIAKEREMDLIPDEIKDLIGKQCSINNVSEEYRYPIDTTNNHKSIINNKKSETNNKKALDYLRSEEGHRELYEKFAKYTEKSIDEEIEKAINWLKAEGKVKKDNIAFARNWLSNSVKYNNLILKPFVKEEPIREKEVRNPEQWRKNRFTFLKDDKFCEENPKLKAQIEFEIGMSDDEIVAYEDTNILTYIRAQHRIKEMA